MPLFSFDEIKLKTGSTIACGRINVVVGANNSGKTTFLKEIADFPASQAIEKFRFCEHIQYDEATLRAHLSKFCRKEQHLGSNHSGRCLGWHAI